MLLCPCFSKFLARTTFVLESLPEAKNLGQDIILGDLCTLLSNFVIFTFCRILRDLKDIPPCLSSPCPCPLCLCLYLMSYLNSLNPMLFKSITYIGSLKHFCLVGYISIFNLNQGGSSFGFLFLPPFSFFLLPT